MKNTLSDLNNYLFEEMERLNDDELMEKDAEKEIRRAKAISGIASQIVQNGNLVLKAHQFTDGKMDAEANLPKILE